MKTNIKIKEIQGIDPIRMQNGAHFQFIKNISDRIAAETALLANNKVKKAADMLVDALKEEDRCLALSRKSIVTDDIKELDIERDSLFIGYKSAVRSFLKTSSTEMRKAATELYQSIKDYTIDPRMQLERETGLITNLIDDAEKKFAVQVNLLGLHLMLNTLKEANQKVEKLITDRTDAKSLETIGALRTARRNSDAAYLYLVKTINAVSILELVPDTVPLIDFMNEVVKRYKEQVLTSRKKKSDDKKPGDDKKKPGEGDTPKPGREEDPVEDQV